MITKNIGFLRTENTGAGFSILSGQNLFLSLVTFLFILSLVYYLIRKQIKTPKLYSFLVILSGAIGNFIDRLIYAHVFDFIKIYQWPIFNFADIYLTFGIIMLIYYEYKN